MPEHLPYIYDVLARCTGFEWDAGNAPKLLARHNVEPGECEQAFFRHPFVVAFDEQHSRTKLRWQALGRTLAERKLYLVFTVRGALIRVIAARDMNQKERRRYAEVQTSVEADPAL
ncbi:MAG: BrnT family toxin [Gemmatimonadales bacterium]